MPISKSAKKDEEGDGESSSGDGGSLKIKDWDNICLPKFDYLRSALLYTGCVNEDKPDAEAIADFLYPSRVAFQPVLPWTTKGDRKLSYLCVHCLYRGFGESMIKHLVWKHKDHFANWAQRPDKEYGDDDKLLASMRQVMKLYMTYSADFKSSVMHKLKDGRFGEAELSVVVKWIEKSQPNF
jgi:hypothetical protein